MPSTHQSTPQVGVRAKKRHPTRSRQDPGRQRNDDDDDDGRINVQDWMQTVSEVPEKVVQTSEAEKPNALLDVRARMAEKVSNSIFPSLQRTHGQASCYGNGVGYALGGIDDDSNVPSPGLISYNTTSAWWSNLTTDGFTDSGTSMFGQLQYIPGFGTAGLLIALGGQTSDRTTWTPSQNLLSFQSVNIFDPVSGIWASQMVSGSQPPARTDFCSVGVQGDNGTYEVCTKYSLLERSC